jgi:predicted metal-dependent hydrolase
MKTPKNIIDYIIIHELCHLKIEGHSLWNLLHKFVPNYEDEIKWLELNSKNILQS